jgi:hypothetical protein
MTDPLWKVASVLEYLRKYCQRCWVPGKFASIDEQTIGFKGNCLALRISNKRKGDGYQSDTICERGYTFSFYFCHGNAPPAPKSVREYLDLLPTARRVIYLMQQLPNIWTRVYMDNIFNSQKLYTAAYEIRRI